MSVLVSPEVVGSYPNLFKAVLRKDAKPEDKPNFSLVTLFTHDAVLTAEYKALVAAVSEAAVLKFGVDKVRMWLADGTLESPFKKSIESKGYDPKRFAVWVTSSSNEAHPPGVLDSRRRNADGKASLITDPREIYPGVLLRVSYSVRAYGGEKGWKPGVKLDLRNVLKVGDGERLVGSGTDGGEFDGIAGHALPVTDAAADLASLMS